MDCGLDRELDYGLFREPACGVRGSGNARWKNGLVFWYLEVRNAVNLGFEQQIQTSWGGASSNYGCGYYVRPVDAISRTKGQDVWHTAGPPL